MFIVLKAIYQKISQRPTFYLWWLILIIGCLWTYILPPEAGMDLNRVAESPSLSAPFGFDTLGRPLGDRLFRGALTSLQVSLLAALICFLLGAIIGGAFELLPKWAKTINWSFIEVLNSVPTLLFSSLLVSTWTLARDPLQPWQLGVLLGVSSWWTSARLARSRVQAQLQEAYIEASRALGAGPIRIFFTHILPSLYAPLGVYVFGQIPSFILTEGFLSFIGVGIQPPQVSWGLLLQEGWQVLSAYPHIILGPAIMVFLTLWSLNSLFNSNPMDKVEQLSR